ncbi:MAG TPA: type II toxin-antitoxin system HicA family toxin [Candidatus Paceibacterota bacterium]
MLFTDLSSARVIKALEKVGFWLDPTRGIKHIGMNNGQRKLTIPRSSRINPHTLKGIIRAAGLTDQEFKESL